MLDRQTAQLLLCLVILIASACGGRRGNGRPAADAGADSATGSDLDASGDASFGSQPDIGPFPTTDAGPIEPGPTCKRLFVTADGYDASFALLGATAVTVADARCQLSADAAGLGGVWHAWLSDGFTDAIDNVQGAGPWCTLEGVEWFGNRTNLLTSPRSREGMTDEFGRSVEEAYGGAKHFYTGTATGGRSSGYDCLGWTADDLPETGTTGCAGSLCFSRTDSWTTTGDYACYGTDSFLCFEQ